MLERVHLSTHIFQGLPHRCMLNSIIYSKLMNNRFWNREGTKTINNRNIFDLNRKGRLKH